MSLDDILDSHRTHRPVLMGILNVTPDSFSDGGRFFDPAAAREQARRLAAEGADIIDAGAESTRPGANRVSADEQIRRLEPVLSTIRDTGLVFGVDTTLSAVAAYALDAGASIVNDISAGRDDPAMLRMLATRGCGVVLMHMLGEPSNMQQSPQYKDVVAEVRDFLAQRLQAAVAAGIQRRRIILDPGIGFGKKLEHNLALLANIDKLVELGQPVLVGASRKRFIGQITGQTDPAQRIAGTIAAHLAAWRRGASIFRLHDVAEGKAAFDVAEAIIGHRSRAIGHRS